LQIYRNEEWAYIVRRPEPWQQLELEMQAGQGVVFAPDPDMLATALSVEVTDLGTEITPDDLPDLEEAFLAGLRAIPNSSILESQSFANEFAIGVDAVQTFEEDGQRRKRWIRLLFKGTMQARVIAQGATVEEYDRLQPIYAPCMTTFTMSARP
jgi:hypothetical protein